MPDLTPATLKAWRKSHALSRRAAAELLRINERTLETLEYGLYPASALWGPLSLLLDAWAELERQTPRPPG